MSTADCLTSALRARVLLAAFCVLLALMSGAAVAREIRFITIDVAPWASYGTGDVAIGVFPDLIHELERRTGHTLRMSLEPFARIERELEIGTQDCAIIIWDETRARIVQRGATVAPHRMGVIARQGVSLRRYADLAPLTISVLRGARIHPLFDADQNLRKDFDTDYLTGLRKLVQGRADAVAGALTTLRHQARLNGMEDMLGESLLLAEIPLVLQCSRRSAHLDLMPELNRAIEAMVRDGTVARIAAYHDF